MRQIRKFALGAISACVVAMAPMAAQAETIQLGFILDRSGSIGNVNWNIIVDGLGNAINDLIPVGGSDTYEISVVTFAASATINVANVLVTDATSRTTLSNSIKALGDGRANDQYIGGTTNYQDAFLKMKDVLDNSSVLGSNGLSYVNFATDGDPTTYNGGTCTAAGLGSGNNYTTNNCGIDAKNALTAAGVDNISIEGIGSQLGDGANLKTNYCHPLPCSTVSPYNFPTMGFYVAVASAAAYESAIRNKIRVVTNQTPEPGTIALVGLALVGAGIARRRMSA